jgi:thiamine kinase-like enzyme
MAEAALEWAWPFSRSELMAGLRRHLAASSLRLLDIHEIPLPDMLPSLNEGGTKLSALAVGVRIDGDDQNLALLLKEPPVSRNGRVLRAIGQREYGVYRRLAQHLPMLVPGLIAGDEIDGWLILEVLSSLRPTAEWTPADYEEAIINLANLHDRFWGLSQDLANYPWLARPLDDDYEDTMAAAREIARHLKRHPHLFWLKVPGNRELLDQLTDSADAIVDPLTDEVMTLIHGDYWPGNIARPVDGRQVVFDWQFAGIGAAILDLVWFTQSTCLQLEPSMPAADMIAFYRQRARRLFKPDWDDEHFHVLWDHALMWLFMTHWLAKLSNMTPETYARIDDRFRTVWLEPVRAAAERRL